MILIKHLFLCGGDMVAGQKSFLVSHEVGFYGESIRCNGIKSNFLDLFPDSVEGFDGKV